MIKVLIVDDSAMVRQIFSQELARESDCLVVGAAPDPYVARDMIVEKKPDVLTLDLEMPRMDGLTFLRKLMRFHPLPTIIVSSLTPKGSELAMDAMAAGAVDVLCKPGPSYTVGAMAEELAAKVRAASKIDLRRHLKALKFKPTRIRSGGLSRTTNQILALGASAGGTIALEKVLQSMPVDTPGTLITQHMPPGFTKSFSQRLDGLCAMNVKEAETGDSVAPGVVLIAPGDQHLLLKRSGARYIAVVKDGPRVNRHRPAVDVMFRSVARIAGKNSVGALLTGMGKDGALGLLEMKKQGAKTFAQDEKSCVVFGMPRAAMEIDAADEMVGIEQMSARLVEALKSK